MNAASLKRSPRLQRTLRVLQRGGAFTTRDLVRKARILAVNSVIAELRQNGCVIECRTETLKGQRRYFYQLISSPEGWDAKSKTD
ncbi:hypothetical protein [Tropicimonas sp. S265A]|uniref:hypothetical protein n=1 Tax=Tropicimonas sp. S265A TaxID=3415134 RepID=UPI003C7BAC0D